MSYENLDHQPLSRKERREEKIIKRLAKRVVRATNKDKKSLDVRGPLNLKRKYNRMPYTGGLARASAKPIYGDHIYDKVNEILEDQGLKVKRTIGKISYYGFGCYINGHNNETVKSYDEMHISKKRPPENGDTRPSAPSGPDNGLRVPDYVPLEWAQQAEVPPHQHEKSDLTKVC